MHDNAHASDFPTGYNGYQTIWGMLPESGILKIGKVHATSTTTKIYIPFFQQRSGDYKALFPDDFFNAGWKIQVLKATNPGIVGKVYDITDFVASTGEFTTATADAAYTAGDVIRLFNTEKYQAGQEFTITKIISDKSTVIHTGNGLALTGAAAGNVTLKRIALQNYATTACGGATSGLYVVTDDADTPLVERIVNAGSDLAATDLALGTTGFVCSDIGYSIASGKKVYLKAGVSALSGAGKLAVHLTFVRNADGANIAAA